MSCLSASAAGWSELERVASHALTRGYKERIRAERTPISASIELTYRCNLHCGHCYCPPGERARELSTDEIGQLLDELAELGTLFLLLTGGEPLLRKDFAAIYRRAKSLGMLVTVFTNGTLIDGRILRLWDELPPHLVEISLYGLTRPVYERVVATPGSYDRCLAAIAALVRQRHALALKCPVTRDNAHEIREIAELAKDLGVDFRYDPLILATMDGRRDPHALRLGNQEIVALEAADAEKDRAWRVYFERESERELPADRLFSCGAGRNSLHIDPYGGVQLCLMVKNFRFDLRRQSLREIYFERFPEILALRREPDSHCGRCPSRVTCANCPGVALWETRRPDAAVPFLCELSAIREARYMPQLRGTQVPSASACAQQCRAKHANGGGTSCRSRLLQVEVPA